MFDVVAGLPVHPLLVHATVVLVPLIGLLVAAAAVWPTLRRRAGWLTGVLGVLAVGLTWVTIQAGEAFEQRLGMTVAEHSAAGRALLPWAAGVAVAGLAISWWGTRTGRRSVARPLVALIVAAGLVAGLGSVVMTVRAGHTGATSVWGGVAG